MQTKSLFSALVGALACCAVVLLPGVARAQEASTVNQAFQIARAAVSPALQDHVVSIYGLGNPASIQKWYIIFYDPSVPSHGRAVLVQNGAIVKTYPAEGGVTYSSRLTFNPSKITGEEPALNSAQNYATRHNIAYDSVRALLKQTSLTHPFRWRIELMDAGKSQGYVLVNAVDDSVADFVSPTSAPHHTAGSGTGSVEGDAEDFGNNVKNTFLGIGGDLQQFFTGERTVDR